MEIFIFLLVALGLWFFMARYLTSGNNNIESKKVFKDPWEPSKDLPPKVHIQAVLQDEISLILQV